MLKHYARKGLKGLFLSTLFLWVSQINAQFTVVTSPPLTANNGQSGVTFELSTTASIIVTEIANTFNTGVQTAEVWYRIGGVQHATGVAPNITTANGWVQLLNNVSVTGNNTTPVPIPGNYSLTIPANTDVGFFIGGGMRYQTHSGTPDQFSDATITIKTGTNYGYGGGIPSPTFHPRQFLGSVTYMFSGPCSDPPTAGFAAASETEVCIGNTTDLSLDSATFGLGQSYQWQVSLDGTTWMNLPGDTTAVNTVTITDTSFYRAIVYCGNGSDTSTMVQVNAIGGSLSGTYTINQNAPASATNFQSFTDFFDAMECGGVTGPVIANVVSGTGPYNERVEIPEIAGVSSVNTITVNGNNNTLAYSAIGTNDRATLLLDGADWITFDNLKIEANGATYAWVVQLTNEADHNTFSNCTFETSTSSASTFVSNVVMSGSLTSPTLAGNSGNYNTFDNNTHIGGYYGFTMNGASSVNRNIGNKVLNSTFEDFYLYGMYLRSQDSLVIDGNDLSRATRTSLSTFYGMYFATGIGGARITKNRIHDNSNQNMTTTNAAYPIYMSSAGGEANNYNVMANNLVYNINNGGTIYLCYLLGAANNHWRIYHNTFSVDMPSSTSTSLTRMLFVSGAQNNMEIKNNIFYLDRGTGGTQYLAYFTSAANNVDMNNNAFYTPNSNVIMGYSGSNLNTFANWQAAGYDVNGVFADPVFLGGTVNDALRPTAPVLNYIGANVFSDVPTDIDGDPRTPSPDPGAYQFEPPQGIDLAVTRFISPGAACPGTVSVEIEVGNFASDTATSFTVNWWINNVAQTPVTQSGIFTPGSLTPVTLGTFTLAAATSYDIEVSIDSVGPGQDIDLTNNTSELMGFRAGLNGTYTINQLATPSVTNFSSFQEAVDALNDFGVCGPVVLNVVSGTGPYNEQIMIEDISGTSATNTVTFNGNGNTLTYLSTSGGERYTLALNGASYVTIDSLNIIAEGTLTSEFGWGVWITNAAEYNTIKNCSIRVDTASTSLNYSAFVMSTNGSSATALGDAGSNNTVENNVIMGGYYGLTINGENASNRSENNQFLHNEITHFRLYGAYIRAQDGLIFKGNEITRANRYLTGFVTFYGIFFTTSFVNSEIVGNRIYNSCGNCDNNTSAQYVVYFSGASGLANQENIFANNIIHDINGDGNAYGIYAFTNNHWKFYHNTISMDATSNSTTTWAVYSSGITPNSAYINNIITADKSGTVIGFNFPTATHGSDIDYNALYVPNGNVGREGTTDYTTMADWQTGTGNDINGQDAPPLFVDPANFDYTPGTPAYHQQGTNLLADVQTDFFGATRGTTPDLGAIEYTPLPCSGPFGFGNDSLTPTSGFFTWDSYETAWVIEWGPVGFIPGSAAGTQVAAGTNTFFEVTGFQSNTCYDVFVAELCSGDTSTWTGPVTICTPKANDAALLGFVSPQDRDCGEDNMDLQVELRNNGFFPITSANITVELSGALNQTITTTYTGNLQMGATDVVTVGQVDFSTGGMFDMLGIVNIPNDEDTSNDTILDLDVRIVPSEPRFENLPFCAGDDSVTLFGVYLPLVASYEW
ncbi:MAG: right-handed parallel beta-helix repeat-containing protein, partial [Cryomorphaceae bacterium]|nr:right-handed parallel beta-helix repeat-containing protein [Cryomorphaceae bacterium]